MLSSRIVFQYQQLKLGSSMIIKSDRINALKKQYDAFLEEDKKRKQRNEYILEKLDKMRHCTALVQVRQKPRHFEDNSQTDISNMSKRKNEGSSIFTCSDQQQLLYNVPRSTDDTLLLQEISKKYILIPKLRPTYNGYIQEIRPSIDDNIDWKSKYDILDELKKHEKEEQNERIIPKNNNDIRSTSEKDIIQKLKECNLDQNSDIQIDKSVDYQQEYPEFLHPETKSLSNNPDKYQSNAKLDDNYLYEQNEKLKYTIETYNNQEIPMEGDHINPQETYNLECADKLHETPAIQLDIHTPTQQNMPKHYADGNIDTIPINAEFHDQHAIKENISRSETGTYLEKEEVNIVHGINSENIDEVIEINNEVPIEKHEPETSEHSIEMINTQEFTPFNDITLEERININPAPQKSTEGDNQIEESTLVVSENVNETIENSFDPVVDPDSSLHVSETYDAEHNEYYNQEANENYAYTQEGIVENYNTEYSAPDQNYQQEYAAYYDGVQSEQPYTTEINENEETSQHYDQNYQQQYGTAEYNQQNYEQYEQYENQGYEQQEFSGHDQTQLEIDNSRFDNQDMTPENVEQQLDNEQGYVGDRKNEEIEADNVEKQDIEPNQKQPITKVADNIKT